LKFVPYIYDAVDDTKLGDWKKKSDFCGSIGIFIPV